MSLSKEDFVALLFFFTLWYSSGTSGNTSRRATSSTDEARFINALRQMPVPPYVMSIVWIALYALVASASFGYWRDAPSNTTFYTATLSLSLVNWVFNKMWTATFFGARSPNAAFIVILVTLFTAIALVIMVIVDLGFTWVAVFFIVYVLWLAIVAYLNAHFLRTIRKPGTESLSQTVDQEPLEPQTSRTANNLPPLIFVKAAHRQ